MECISSAGMNLGINTHSVSGSSVGSDRAYTLMATRCRNATFFKEHLFFRYHFYERFFKTRTLDSEKVFLTHLSGYFPDNL